MKLKLNKYPLIEVINEFDERKLGKESMVLEALTEGKLIASIEFPSYLPRLQPVPSEHWKDVEAEELISESRGGPGRKQIEESTIDGKALEKSERAILHTIAKAAAEHDIDLIAETIRPVVQRRLKLESLTGYDGWLSLIKVFQKLSNELKDDADHEYDAYVTREHWDHFCLHHTPTEAPKDTGGRTQNKYWVEILWEIIQKISAHQGTSIKVLAGAKTNAELAKIVVEKVKLDNEAQKGTIIGDKAVAEAIGEHDLKK